MKTCKETKSFLHFWLRVWMLEEETFISYMHRRLMLEGSNGGLPQRSSSGDACLLLWAMGGCSKVLEESPGVKNIEIWSTESCNHHSIAQSTHGGHGPVWGLPSALSAPQPGRLCISRRRGIWLVVSECRSRRRDGCSLPSTASTSRVTGPALPQVAKPEPLFIICCYTVKYRGHFPADRGLREKVLLLPSS